MPYTVSLPPPHPGVAHVIYLIDTRVGRAFAAYRQPHANPAVLFALHWGW